MSTINVTNLKGRGGASPNLPDGANVTGVSGGEYVNAILVNKRLINI